MKANAKEALQAAETLGQHLEEVRKKNAETIEKGLRIASEVIAQALCKPIVPAPKRKSSLQELIEAKGEELAEVWFVLASRDPEIPHVVFRRKGAGVAVGPRDFERNPLPEGVSILMEIDNEWTQSQAAHFISDRLWSVPVRELIGKDQKDVSDETPLDAWKHHNAI